MNNLFPKRIWRDHLKPGRGRGDVRLGRGTGTRDRDAGSGRHT